MWQTLAGFLRPFNSDIALAWVATLLVIYGDSINGFVRNLVRRQMVVVRILVFIALCTFGYGALTVWVVPFVARFLSHQPANLYVILVVGGFVLLGIMAERFNRR
ncbi:DUF3392 family protein [Parathalassolituus penaei]|uniref:DUF3392 family protein n=1 Tax=Parathalassolituus penaei TaxID=2997323 RepID=A0A9X3EFC4_9GAMM|nr:DUF3392 family protein [Parathalassolituus penaei]MCY0965719.1 DUF3392 family protein [Parathalassolituus penaei]